ncbi:aminomethyltransferase family protein [Aminobacter sp. Piv2-1]|uniref:aminomethyltransferase family protein n=1 Tax=Aminobacter sp. Piv2-1 TaxID=3031122 RepID=UPI0030981744
MISSIHLGARDPIRISAHRFEKSPFQSCWQQPDMLMGVYAGRCYPIDVGDDEAEKYWLLRQKCALYDVPERPIEIRGKDVVRFLERIFARHVADVKEGRGRYVIACTPQGGIYMDGVLFRLSEDRYWVVQPDGALVPWLIAYSGDFDVAISDPASRVLQIQGPTSRDVMRAATSGAIGDDFKYFHSGFFDIGGQNLYVSRTGWTGEIGYEVYTQGNATDCPRLWNDLLEAGRPYGLQYSTIRSMEIRRIEAGILDNLTDFDWTMTPFEAGLSAFLDLDQPNFVGRDALLAASRLTRLFGVKCAAAKPSMGDVVSYAGKPAGRITAGAWSPFLNVGIGYVRFDEANAWLGHDMSIHTDGTDHPCSIVALPFYDPEKRIPRGLG